MGNFVRLENREVYGASGLGWVGWLGWLIRLVGIVKAQKMVEVASGRFGGNDLEITAVILGCLKLKH